MQCTRPLIMHGTKIPCGTCRACRDAKAREWSLRMIHELEYHKSAVFITLTYDDKEIPADGSLHKEEFQNFMKTLRKKCTQELKYYACGEYGDGGRPHYHAILYGLEMCTKCKCCSPWARRGQKAAQDDCMKIDTSWGKGYVHIGDVTPGSCRYVADYLQKNSGEEDYGGRQKAFNLMSKGLGKQWILDNQTEAQEKLSILGFKGRIGLPRYYQKKLKDLAADTMFGLEGLIRSVAYRKGKIRDKEKMDWLEERYQHKDLGYGYRKEMWQHNANLGAKKRLQENKV